MAEKTNRTYDTFLCGRFMGWAGIIPGVSSGTVVVITGIYSRMIASLNLLTLKGQKKKKQCNFLDCWSLESLRDRFYLLAFILGGAQRYA